MFNYFGPGYASSDAVTLRGDRVRKRVDPQLLGIETSMTRIAGALGRQSRLFRVPEVVDCNRSTCTIELERIDGLLTLGQWLALQPLDLDVLRRVGAALACVHTKLAVPAHLRRKSAVLSPPPDELVTIHGDFNSVNVCYRPSSDEIVILDWSCAATCGPGSTVGHWRLDICQMLRSLIVHQSNLPRAMRRFKLHAQALIEGYQSLRRLDTSSLGRSLIDVSNLYRSRQQKCVRWPKRVFYIAQAWLAHRAFVAWQSRGRCASGCLSGRSSGADRCHVEAA